jgi:hypothetical protein
MESVDYSILNNTSVDDDGAIPTIANVVCDRVHGGYSIMVNRPSAIFFDRFSRQYMQLTIFQCKRPIDLLTVYVTRESARRSESTENALTGSSLGELSVVVSVDTQVRSVVVGMVEVIGPIARNSQSASAFNVISSNVSYLALLTKQFCNGVVIDSGD